MQKLHPKAVWIFFFKFLSINFFAIAFLVAISWQLSSIIVSKIPYFFAFFLLLVWILGSWVWAKLSYNAYKYELTEDAFKKEHGVIWKKYISIPYERIQNIDIYRGILVRILGLSDLMIQTTGYAGIGGGGFGREPEGKLIGISKEKAEKLREELIRRAKGAKSGYND